MFRGRGIPEAPRHPVFHWTYVEWHYVDKACGSDYFEILFTSVVVFEQKFNSNSSLLLRIWVFFSLNYCIVQIWIAINKVTCFPFLLTIQKRRKHEEFNLNEKSISASPIGLIQYPSIISLTKIIPKIDKIQEYLKLWFKMIIYR